MGRPRTPLIVLLRAIASRQETAALRMLDEAPEHAREPLAGGASRRDPASFFLEDVGHHVYAGDTALHVAAAAYTEGIARTLLSMGAAVRARNRRGAEPLHYAADGVPGSQWWDPKAQARVIALLVEAGADPNATDKSGVAPLHRAVRTRCAAAVNALLSLGADSSLANGTGSTPLDLARGNTGRGESGSPQAQEERAEILAMLLRHGASPADPDQP